MSAIIILVIDFAIIIAVGMTAENRGRSPLGWMALALFISFFTFLPLLALGDTDAERARKIAEEQAQRRPSRSPVAELRELSELRDSGALTNDEFEAKKATLMERI